MSYTFFGQPAFFFNELHAHRSYKTCIFFGHPVCIHSTFKSFFCPFSDFASPLSSFPQSGPVANQGEQSDTTVWIIGVVFLRAVSVSQIQIFVHHFRPFSPKKIQNGFLPYDVGCNVLVFVHVFVHWNHVLVGRH